jgi:LAS superfamily LD-carboxypeptidase LdcB
MRRRLAMTVSAVVAALVLSACLPPPPPPQNGRLPDSALTTVTPSCRIANDLADPLIRMIYDAWVAGVQILPETRAYNLPPAAQPPRNESCYRSYEMQEFWRSLYCFFGACQLAAVPGTSIHGWGRAVDFEDQSAEMHFGSPGYHWLKANAARYGFFHPAWAEPGGSAPEAWHWEHP